MMAPHPLKQRCAFTVILAGGFRALSIFASLNPALAKNPLDLTLRDTTGKSSPLLIESEQGTMCDHKTHTCTAIGNVKVTKGEFRLECQKLLVVYREPPEGLASKKPEIERIEATGNARFTGRPGEQAFAPRIIYTLATQQLILESPQHSIASQKKNAYPSLAALAALPRVIKDQNLLIAPKITVFLAVDSHGKHTINRIKADGRVLISTPDEITMGDSGIYEPDKQLATLKGNVYVTHKKGQLSGSKAQTPKKQELSSTQANVSSSAQARPQPPNNPQKPAQ
jgi:lipopolysaccharide export system protein LptA